MKRLVILLLTLLLLAGCVQYDEELWINRNGSGHATIRVVHRSPYENPEEIMRKAALPGINLQSTTFRKGLMLFTLSISSLKALMPSIM